MSSYRDYVPVNKILYSIPSKMIEICWLFFCSVCFAAACLPLFGQHVSCLLQVLSHLPEKTTSGWYFILKILNFYNANTVHVKSIIRVFFVFTMNWNIRSDTLILIQILVLLDCIPCSWEKNPNKFDINVSSVTWNLNNSIQVRRIFTM